MGKVTTSISIEYHKSPPRIAADELFKKATAYKNSGNWDEAIKSLRDAYSILGNDVEYYPIAASLRLPLFLQQAGHFEEAMLEFKRLLREVDHWFNVVQGPQAEIIREYARHAAHASIYDKMRLVCKRQKLLDRAAEYSALADLHNKEHMRLMEIEQQSRRR